MKLNKDAVWELDRNVHKVKDKAEFILSLSWRVLDLMHQDKEVNQYSDILYQEVNELFTLVSKSLVTLEEADENLDLEKTELESVDKHFEGEPITDFIDAKVEYARGNISDEVIDKIKKATMGMVVSQGGTPVYQRVTDDLSYSEITTGSEEINTKVSSVRTNTKGTLEDFVGSIVSRLGFDESEKTYADSFGAGLLNAINVLEERPGRSEFYVTVNGESLKGNLSVSSTHVTVEINGICYEFKRGQEVESEEQCSNDGCCCDGDDACVSCGGCDCPQGLHCKDEHYDCTYTNLKGEKFFGKLNLHKEVNLYNAVEEIDEVVAFVVNSLMDTIKDHLDSKAIWSGEDYELARYYLKNLPYTDRVEIDSLSSLGVSLAWNKENNLMG